MSQLEQIPEGFQRWPTEMSHVELRLVDWARGRQKTCETTCLRYSFNLPCLANLLLHSHILLCAGPILQAPYFAGKQLFMAEAWPTWHATRPGGLPDVELRELEYVPAYLGGVYPRSWALGTAAGGHAGVYDDGCKVQTLCADIYNQRRLII